MSNLAFVELPLQEMGTDQTKPTFGGLQTLDMFCSPPPSLCRCPTQDTFDHHKGQKSAISGCRLHWIFVILLLWISSFSRDFCIIY